MSRISDIITEVRSKLSDKAGQRWSTPRLVQLVDEAQKDICRQAKLLKKKSYLNIQPGKATYLLPTDLIRVERVLYKGKTISIYTHSEMDKLDPLWEELFGPDVKSIIYDKMNAKEIKIYPIPPVSEDDIPVTPLLGMVENIQGFYMQNLLGVLTDLELSADEIQWGDVPYENSLVIYYSRYPIKITSVDDELELTQLYDKAITYYVTGKALRDDMDAQNRQVGAEELSFYERELMEAKRDNIVDSNVVVPTVKYRGAF